MALTALTLAAQDPSFRARSRLVLVPTTVTDERGAFVRGLDAGDFALYDNGHPRPIASVDSFDSALAPISLVVAVQTSGISAPALVRVRKIGSLIQPLVTGERGGAAVLAFDQQIAWLQDFTRDPAAIAQAFAGLRTGAPQAARMHDAVAEACARLETRPNSRRVVLLISESKDRGSETALEAALAKAQKAGVVVYSAAYSSYASAFASKPSDITPVPGGLNLGAALGELFRLGKVNTVNALATGTGGAHLRFVTQRALESAVERLGEELHGQYVISFVPPADTNGAYRPLEVRVTNGRKLSVRARPGYFE
ncbi:MAG: VWA domain-containing protein [Bryobacteraceae bacterium]|nr:VWA domain-containing protein [Bryobacteraceae bacterium]